MLCVDGRAKATMDQFEEERKSAQKYSELKKQLSVVLDSATDREAKMAEFERRIQKLDESEDELMTNLLQLFRAANPEAKTEEINRAVKRKFLQGISDELRRNIFIFCYHPFDFKVSHQDFAESLSRCCCASCHNQIFPCLRSSRPPAVLAATNPPPTSSSSDDATLQAILSLSSKFEEQTRLTQQQLNEQQEQINMLRHPPTIKPFSQQVSAAKNPAGSLVLVLLVISAGILNLQHLHFLPTRCPFAVIFVMVSIICNVIV